MTSQGKSFWLASVCLAAGAWLCLSGAPAGADEVILPLSLDMTPTGSLKTSPADPASAAPLRASQPTGAERQAEQAGFPIQPELPPDVATEPPSFLVPSVHASPPGSPSNDKTHSAPRPVAKLNDEPQATAPPVGDDAA